MKLAAILLLMLPLLAGLVNGLFSQTISKKNAGIIASSLMIASSVLAMYIFYCAGINNNILHITFSKWFTFGKNSVNWAIYVDSLTSIMFVVVTWVSAVVHVYSLGYMKDDADLPKFLSFLSLFTFFMLALVSADNFLQLFFGWEGVGLCSYLLIGFWYKKPEANKAAIKAFIVNRITDIAFIFGIIMLILYTGHADFVGVFTQGEELSLITFDIMEHEFSVLDIICLLLFIGCMGKSAQLGAHIWLPDAMEGPTPVSALIHAATMVTAGVFLVARCSYLFEYSPFVLHIITYVGGITCLFAASIAVTQTDIKKIIAYSTCSQLGYMFLACGVSAYQAAIFHLATHAAFKALLFLSAGNVIHGCHEQNIFKMGGLAEKMPITYINFWVGSLAIIGIFPLAGFYSKDLILESVYATHNIGNSMFIIGITAAVLTAIYSMKIIILVFHGTTNLTKNAFENVHEAKVIMNIPLIFLIAGSLFAGMIGYYILDIGNADGYFVNSIFNLKHSNNLSHVPLVIELLPLIAGVGGMLIGFCCYKNKLYSKIADNAKFIYSILYNKYYFDEIYNSLIVNPLIKVSKFINIFDQKAVDRFGPQGLSAATRGFAFVVSRFQTGYIFNYTFITLLAIVICISYFVFNLIRII
jgi:NADH-quinone oxidoreductase subunit L